MNQRNLQKVLDQITLHPETWNQRVWHCGSTHCIAGWAQILSGKPANVHTASQDARAFLDLTLLEAYYFFNATQHEISAFMRKRARTANT